MEVSLMRNLMVYPGVIWERHTYNITHLSPKEYAEAQPGHLLFAKCVPSHDVIGGEPIAISGANSRADTDQKIPNITLPDPGFEPRTSERCRTVHEIQLRHRDNQNGKGTYINRQISACG
ncbi:hypothetical protein O3G_MSEX015499 [Manduca sexta]|uniref:Uncharacterized protein n=1 Tax=Manduca sexta TaxID=7130 RepID=A0A922D1P9_MANSE|nr:hypothetical protein O3G_MSEX015499 [Manduca sexta]